MRPKRGIAVGQHLVASHHMRQYVTMLWPTLSTIRGHTLHVRLLAQLIANGRWGHAYLFAGPGGVGRRTVAQALLGRLACLQPASDHADPCGTCRSCAALNRNQHPDLTVLERDGQFIKIEQVREMTNRLRYDPVVGRIKAVIIDECDRLHEAAANALLKTLEEPPPATVFVLITAKPQALLDTIRSRCQMVRFGELSPVDVAALLQQGGVDPLVAQAASALAAGSLDQGKALADPAKIAVLDLVAELGLSLGARPAVEAAFWPERIGKALRSAKAVEVTADGDSSDNAEPLAATKGDFSRADLQWAVEALRAVLRDALLTCCAIDPSSLPHARHKPALLAMASRVDPARLAEVIDSLTELESSLVLNPNPKLAWTAAMTVAAQKLA
ncbi:MAG: DNA polymerase III subunit delta' [Myxococcales bacterium]|nr:DNA polymerase III subunit delta' [Myxococcales bacterium]